MCEHDWDTYIPEALPVTDMEELLEKVKGTRVPEADAEGKVTHTLRQEEVPEIIGDYLNFLVSAKIGGKLVQDVIDSRRITGDREAVESFSRFSSSCRTHKIDANEAFGSTQKFLNALLGGGKASEKDIKVARKIISGLQ